MQNPASMAIPYHTREADLPASAATICRLWVGSLVGHSESSAADKLRLGYEDNAAGQGTVLLLYPGTESEPCGVQGLHPRVFHLGARRITAAGLADFAVESAHRSLGPALMLMRDGVRLARDRFDLLYGLPNQKAAAVLARAGLKKLGMVQRFAKPLRSRAKLAARLPPFLAGLLAPCVDFALRAQDQLRRIGASPRLVCEATGWSDPTLDDLWARRPASLLLSERSSAMLRWRLGAPERGAWRVCLARDRAGAVRGYVAWRIKDGFAEVGDFFSDVPEQLTAPLMLAFTPIAREAGAHSVSVTFFGCEPVARALVRGGMTPRPQQAPLFVLPDSDPAFGDPRCWYLTGFDNDED